MTQTIHALLVGINRYAPASSNGDGITNLDGAVADAHDMRALLEERFAAAPERIRVLTDEQATRRGILDAIRDHLALRAEPHDIVVLHFSGHGSYVDRRGDAEREGTLVAHDSRGEGGSDLTASELAAALREVRTRHVALILDCCHAGNLLLSRSVGRNRFVPPREQGAGGNRGAAPRSLSTTLSSGPFVLLAAAGPFERAIEQVFDREGARGVFTRAFTELARRPLAMSYRTLMEAVRECVLAFHLSQHPQLEGPLVDHVVFGHDQQPYRRRLSAFPIDESTVRLSGGVFSGVTIGSRYAVYAPDAHPPFDETTPLAELEISRVNAADAQAIVSSGGPVPPGSPVVERFHRHESPLVTVRVRNVPGLRTQLREDTHLSVIGDGDEKLDDGRLSTPPACDIVAVGVEDDVAIELPAFAITRRITRTEDDPPLAQHAANVVRHWARWLNLLRLRNAYSSLQVDLDIIDARRADTGELHLDFRHACDIRYKVRNRSGMPLFIAVLVFGDDGSIKQVFPPHPGPRPLEGDRDFRETLSVTMALETSRELYVLKAFGTTAACDFTVLELSASRGPGSFRPRHGLEELLAQASAGGRPIVRRVTDDWTASQVALHVVKTI